VVVGVIIQSPGGFVFVFCWRDLKNGSQRGVESFTLGFGRREDRRGGHGKNARGRMKDQRKM
jgi:hypothetical protein